MDTTEYVELIRRLHARTQDGRLRWEKTVDEGVFQTAVPDYAVRLRLSGSHVFLSIYDDQGALVDTIGPEQVGLSTSGMLEQVYDMARRQAMNVDKAINRLIEALA